MEKEIKEWLHNAFYDLFNSEDNEIIDRSLREECINHRFACHLENNKPVNFSLYYIDMEYDKNCSDSKYIELNGVKAAIRPDILIHRRIDDPSDNLIAFECKKESLTKEDKDKLKQLKLDGYNYKYCIAVQYMPRKKYFYISFPENEFKKIKINKQDCDLNNL